MRRGVIHTLRAPHHFLLAVLLAVQTVGATAQQRLGRTMQQRPPFADTALHQLMQHTLLHMDAFHGDSALALINQALPGVVHEEQPEEMHYLLTYRAEVLYYEGLFNEAMRDLDEAERLALQLGDSTLIANAYNLKGLLHENIQDSREALPYLRKALLWYPRTPAARYPVTELHHIHGNMGSYLATLGELDSAETHVRTSLQLAQEAGAHRATAVAWWALGHIALKRDRPLEALDAYDRSWAVADAEEDHDIGVDALVGRGHALTEAGRMSEARAALVRAQNYLDTHRAGIGFVTQRNHARQASHAYEHLGDLDRAMAMLGEWHRIDSTITTGNIRSALAMQAALIRADNDLEVERLERERVAAALTSERRTRWLVLIGSALIIIAISAIFLVNSARQRHERRLAELETLRAQHERTIAELRVREQVGRDLHDDLGVGLSALKLRSEMALRNDPASVAAPLLREQAGAAEELITSMRHIIWTLQDDQGTLDDLVAYIVSYARNYLDPHGLRLDVRTDAEWPYRKLSTEQRRNLFLIVKEALHNVVKHAGATQVILTAAWRNGLLLRIEDDGHGMNGTPRPHGHGLVNMRKRAGHVGAELRMGAGEADRGVRVELDMPLG